MRTRLGFLAVLVLVAVVAYGAGRHSTGMRAARPPADLGPGAGFYLQAGFRCPRGYTLGWVAKHPREVNRWPEDAIAVCSPSW